MRANHSKTIASCLWLARASDSSGASREGSANSRIPMEWWPSSLLSHSVRRSRCFQCAAPNCHAAIVFPLSQQFTCQAATRGIDCGSALEHMHAHDHVCRIVLQCLRKNVDENRSCMPLPHFARCHAAREPDGAPMFVQICSVGIYVTHMFDQNSAP